VPQDNVLDLFIVETGAANRKRRLSASSDVGPYIYDVKISGFTRSSIYIYDISRLRVKLFASSLAWNLYGVTYIHACHDATCITSSAVRTAGYVVH
jgi:hypothetical protein